MDDYNNDPYNYDAGSKMKSESKKSLLPEIPHSRSGKNL